MSAIAAVVYVVEYALASGCVVEADACLVS